MATAARPFADMLAHYLTIQLPITRACSPHTICAYRDAFALFLRFMDEQRATPPDRVSFADFTTGNVEASSAGCTPTGTAAQPPPTSAWPR